MGTGESRIARLIGIAPINAVLFVLGKAAAALASALALLQLLGVPIRPPLVRVVPLVLAAAGLLVIAVAGRALGAALRVGLPGEPTALMTSGPYRFSRNPIYLGGHLLLLGCCLYCPHPVVIVGAALGSLIHHRIVLAEERFLDARFGDAWRTYRAGTPRYIGWPSAAAP